MLNLDKMSLLLLRLLQTLACMYLLFGFYIAISDAP